MNDLPPKTVKAQLVRLDDSLKRIERTQVAGIQRAPGSLPVLEAFQLFLESERKSSRQRIMMLTVVAMVIMLAAAATGVVLVRTQLHKSAADVHRISARTAELEAAVAGVEQKNADEFSALETRFRDESHRIIEQYTALLKEQTTSGAEENGRRVSLETIQERLDRLEAENALLKTRLATLPTAPISDTTVSAIAPAPPVEIPATDAPPASASASIVPTPALEPGIVPTPPDTASATTTPERVTVIEHPTTLLMTVIPDGQTQGIRWQLPRALIRE